MSQVATGAGLLDWGVVSRPYPGEQVCGDAHLVAPFEGGVLVGVIDGLGHGEEAALASRLAVASLRRTAGQPLRSAIEACHADLRRTRGAAISLASIHGPTGILTWVGVGNVEAVVFRAAGGRETIVPRAGVVGYQLPPLREASFPIARGDLLVLASDGIFSGFHARPPCGETSEGMADAVLEEHGRGDDDALVLAARYLGTPP